jgi:hypothetical protein
MMLVLQVALGVVLGALLLGVLGGFLGFLGMWLQEYIKLREQNRH